MDKVRKADLVGLFAHLRDVFTEQREALITLDGRLGDSDLGITMNKGFNAAHGAVEANAADDLGKTLNGAGLAFAKAAPSTMGTLTGTGLMRGGKALLGRESLGTGEFALFWRAFRDGVAERGKAKLGDKTVLDVLDPIAATLEAAAREEASLSAALELAAQAAATALDATKAMKAQHGKAAVYQDGSIGVPDAGGTVAHLMIDAMRAFVTR
ncbi:dihydroxyacetone kinase subunit L [Salinarimonas soli]|uniref:Dihydroxyacetone kinase subunit L n=1 Tax=Salinarimonas soli TaxID=1638099 RepID=A0A5B2V9E0_9HYPH|nr:dihydroxyacetone kinase subunit L [Salinarimonas soli]KAA2235631.1 dihydroxyacetone kinase subunit L [Salinarimonas soli]